MLNRRILRIKVMQALYALKQSEVSNYHGGLEYFSDQFAPDLNSNEKQDLPKLEANKKLASGHYEEYFLSGNKNYQDEAPEITNVVDQAISDYHKKTEKDKKHFGKLMLNEMDRISDLYLLLLRLPLDLYEFGEQQKNKGKSILADNQFLALISSSKPLNDHSGWDRGVLTTIYKLIKEDQEFSELKSGSLEEDRKIITQIFKIVLKNKDLVSFFEEKDLNWAENRSIVKNLVLKTFKAVEEKDKMLNILELSTNWEEDKQFFKELYDKTIAGDKELEQIVTEKVRNWDIERVAVLDRVILKLAISEMIHFPSIPIKVTINEYIELSKLYSTPKSKQFINGILDSASAELVKIGRIRKSGRGLIDNK
ncbi:MAG: transcription antitermination factor NusB [Cytophagaceae bacterium]